jgi:NAD(P)H dehydrogenase (quinone)
MNVHIVLAHPEPRSFNGHLAAVAAEAVRVSGGQATITDLYASGFDPCERGAHYRDRVNTTRFEAQSEQRHASQAKTLPTDVTAEIARLDAADLVILQYPMWWHLPPAILKGWMDRVFVYGEVYKSKQRFENGRFVGKRAMLSVTVGTSEATYAHDGRSGDIDLLLWPINFSLAYVGFEVLAPFVAYGVEAGLRYSEGNEIERRLQGVIADWRGAVTSIDARPTVPFNRMSEWGADGRIVPGAPVHSPFIRRRKDLVLE